MLLNFGRKKMHTITLQAAMTLTEWSERTLRRRVADGTVQAANETASSNKTLILLDSIKQDSCIPLQADTLALLKQADAGDAYAQTDLALLFCVHGKTKSGLYWLELAAKQNFADALHWLGYCYLRGEGVAQNDNLAMMWIAKAAAQGHVIARAQIEALSLQA